MQHDDDCDDRVADTDAPDPAEVSADVQADEEQHDPDEILGEDPTRVPAGEEHVVGQSVDEPDDRQQGKEVQSGGTANPFRPVQRGNRQLRHGDEHSDERKSSSKQ
jgi:hypothetical protein